MSAVSDINNAKTVAAKPANLQQMLDSPAFVAKIQKSIRGTMTPDIIGSLAMTQMRKVPKLAECDPMTLFGAIITCSQNGWELGRDVHLIPFKDTVTVIPDYRGLIKNAIQSDQVSKVEAHIVHTNDLFEFELGLHEKLRHAPAMKARGEFLCVYAVVTLADGNKQYEVMNHEDVMNIKKRSKSANSGPWVTDFNMMARKTVIKRILRYVGSSAEANKMIDMDNEQEMGEQNNREWFGDNDFIEGEVVKRDAGNTKAETPKKQTRKSAPKKQPAKTEAKPDPQASVVHENGAAAGDDAKGTEPLLDAQPEQTDALEETGGDVITYAQVAQGINEEPTENDSQAWLNAARGVLPGDQIAELVQLHLGRFKQGGQ